VAPVPWRAHEAERLLAGGSLTDPAHVRRAAQATTVGAEPLAHNGYKIPLVHAVFEQAIASLSGREGHHAG
jgi:xanthine dehydrogenase YagS FAD-binding subunit